MGNLNNLKKCKNCFYFTSKASVAGICKRDNKIVMKNSSCEFFKEIPKQNENTSIKKYKKIIIRDGKKIFID